MEFINPWTWIQNLSSFFQEVGKYCSQLWNFSFTIFGQTFYFWQIATSALIVLIGWLLIKKLVF